MTAKPIAETRCLADVQVEPIDWLWKRRFARGKLNILAGQPGLGKSQMAAMMAAKVTRGGNWPDGMPCPIGNVIFICCEDDAADTIVPRLDAAGADREKVHIVDWIVEKAEQGQERRRSFDIGKDSEVIRDLCKEIGDVALIVIDPVSAYLGGADSHKTSDVRAALAPLQTIAAEIGVCVVLISHLNKGGVDASAMSRVAGSGAFVAAARSAWLVGANPQDETSRLLVPLKNNIGDDKTGFSYRIKSAVLPGNIETSHVEFDLLTVEVKAEDVIGGTATPSASNGAALLEAMHFLTGELANGARRVVDLKAEADDAGISWRTVERAKSKLGVRSEKDHAAGGEWRWEMPARADKDRQGRQHRHSPDDKTAGGVPSEREGRQGLSSENVGDLGGVGGRTHLNGSAWELF